MKENYAKTFAFLISPACEGFVSNLHGDTGGETVNGVSRRWFPKEHDAIMAAYQSGQKDFALELTSDFYYKNFWLPLGCDDLPGPLDSYAFVEGVNDGEQTVKIEIKAILGHSADAQEFLDWCVAHYDTIAARNPNEAKWLPAWKGRLQRMQEAFPMEKTA